jgi:DNA-binding SARP family transcriptional activator
VSAALDLAPQGDERRTGELRQAIGRWRPADDRIRRARLKAESDEGEVYPMGRTKAATAPPTGRSASLRFRLLGPIEVLDGQHLIPVAGTKTRTLLAVLLIHVNTVVSRDRLVEYLWGEHPPSTAVGTLHSYVSRLRRLLGAELLVTRAHGYQLTVEPDRLDVACFERLLQRGMADVRCDRPRQAIAALRDALGLWRGPCLQEFGDEPFAIETVVRMQGLRAASVTACLGAELALGRHAEVVEELRQLVIEHPTREDIWCHLMLALYRCGRQAEALASFHRARTVLRRDLGIEPGPALRAMQDAILHQDPALNWVPPNPLPTALPKAADRPLIGRTSDMAWLCEAWRQDPARAPGLVLVSGEPGVGKTRLAVELALQAHRDGATVLWGRALRNSLAPYEPFAEALRDYADRLPIAEVVDRIGTAAADLGLLVPGMPGATSTTRVPKARRHRLFEAVSDLLRGAAAKAPVLLVLDDLHSADRSTLLLLEHLVRHPHQISGMILGLYRDTDLTPDHPLAVSLAALGADGLTIHRRVRGLSPHEVEQLIRSITGAVPAPQVARCVSERAAGNPLFVTEIVRSLRSARTDSADRDPAGAVRRLAVPGRIRDVIAQRLSRLAPAARRALGAASAIGPQFTLSMVAAVLDESERRLSEVLEEGIAAGVIREHGTGPGQYVFASTLLRDTVYEGLTKTHRAALHQRAGEVLERLGAEGARASFGELAHHFHQAAINDANRAVDYAVLAGDEALALLGFTEARTYYERARDLVSLADPTDSDRLGRLALALGHARLGEYDIAGARRAHLEAARSAIDRDATDDLASAVMGIVSGIEFTEVDPEAVAQLEQALSRLGTADKPRRAMLLASLARALPDDDPRVVACADEAVTIARQAGDPETLAVVLSATLLATWAPDNSDDRLAVANELIRLGGDLGWVELSMESLNWRSSALEERGDLSATDADLVSLMELVEQARRPFYTATGAMRRGSRALLEGRYDDAERSAATMLANGGGSRNFQAAYGLQTLGRYRDVGRLAEITDDVAAFVESRPDMPAWRAAEALLHLEVGNHGAAASALGELAVDGCAALPRDWLWVGALGHLCEVSAGLRDVVHAPMLLRLLDSYTYPNVVIAHGVLSMGASARLRGLLCTNLGRLDEAAQHFDAAIELNSRWRASPWLVRTQLGYADMLCRRGGATDRARAGWLLDAARTGAARLGMVLPGSAMS